MYVSELWSAKSVGFFIKLLRTAMPIWGQMTWNESGINLYVNVQCSTKNG